MHECIRKFTTRKIDYCSGEGYNKCYGNNPMILEVWYQDQDGHEFACDNWVILEVDYCPFCGVKND